jgi:hypothetical protein
MNLFRAKSYAPGDLIEVAGAPVRLKVSPRATRVSLRIDHARREVIASAPSQRRLHEAVAFAGQRAQWITAHIGALPRPDALAPGDVITVFGRPPGPASPPASPLATTATPCCAPSARTTPSPVRWCGCSSATPWRC